MTTTNPVTVPSGWHAFLNFVRQVRALAGPYFSSQDKWKARGLLAAIVALNLATVYVAVLFNKWYGAFYDAMEQRNEPVFWQQMGVFSYLAFGGIVIAVYKFYLTQLLEVRWREWMTNFYLERWLKGQVFYTMELARFSATPAAAGGGATPDNPDQRIQEDINKFTAFSVSLSMGLLNAVVTLVSFIGILWTLSGPISFSVGGQNFTIQGYMVWAAVLYCLVGSVLSHYIGKKQVVLNFFQERYEADFRFRMVRVREFSESIALDKGEAVEKAQLRVRFADVLANYLRLIRAQKNLIWFTSFFGQAAIIFPFVVAAPRLFSGAIQLGQLMQIATAFGKVQDSLSWFVDNYASLASWAATTQRLSGFEETFVRLGQQKLASTATHLVADNALSVSNITLQLPDGKTLLSGVSLRAEPGDHVLLTGPSGSGKSSLFRMFSGIWPFSSGVTQLPANAMFIPQRPYFPDGLLRDALAYPEPASKYPDAVLAQALTDAMLPQLCSRLDDSDAWGQKLSGGEQQRLAIARVMLKKPAWIFADEATSALDTAAENALYAKLLAAVKTAGGGLVSIAHRPSVAAFHNQQWALVRQDKDGDGAVNGAVDSAVDTTNTATKPVANAAYIVTHSQLNTDPKPAA